METKISRVDVGQQVYQRLRDQILEGILGPGEQLRDYRIAEQLGVSRTPVREALLRLREEGFVQSVPGKSTKVSSIDFQGAHNLYSILWTLEKLALTKAFGFIQKRHIEEMRNANSELAGHLRLNQRLLALRADERFHNVYVFVSGNSELQRLILELKAKLIRLDLYYFDQIQDAELSVIEHDKIIAAIEARDLDGALCALEANWKQSFSRFNI
jgi:DNA-binding GntR family transcriptional regulator